MTDEKLTAKKNLAIIVFASVGILIICLVNYNIIFGRWPKPASSLPFYIGKWIIEVGVILACLGYWLKFGRTREAYEEFTLKKALAIVVLVPLAVVPACILYFAIIFLSYPFIGFYSWILSLSITFGTLLALAYTLKTRKKRRSKN